IDGKDVVLYVGRLHRVKHVCDLIHAFKKIYENNKNAVLLIAGEGVLESTLKSMVEENALGKSVLFLGSKNGKELANLFSTVDVVVQPHGGQVLLEAALAATPCVVYDFDWHREFVEDGKMGFIVPFRDTEKLAEETQKLLRNKELKRQMGFYSREVATVKYSREKSIENEGAVFRESVRG
ncbi:glycosyltransferase, partial [Candidatus Omnitrophota bacterium]